MTSPETTAPVDRGERLRIGDVAELTGCTARSIRYWEEVGLLPTVSQLEKGRHRTYGPDDVERIRALVRVRELLGINLDELRDAYETELSRSEIRARWQAGGLDVDEQRLLLEEALGHIDVQLTFVHDRLELLAQFAGELRERRSSVVEKLDALAAAPPPASEA